MNPNFRRVRSFLNRRVKPFLIRVFVACFLVCFLGFFILKFLKPTLLEAFYSKTYNAAIRHLNFTKMKFDKINIFGIKRVKKENILSIVNDVNVSSDKSRYEFSIQDLVVRIRDSELWVDQVTASRVMPNILNITIVEYEPFAIWQHSGKKFVIDKNGHPIEINQDNADYQDFIIISGDGANINAISLFNIFASNPQIAKNIYSATWVGNRRWDVRLNNGILIKLPESNISDAWDSLVKIYKMSNLTIGLKAIDLRISDKIYLEYENNKREDVKSL